MLLKNLSIPGIKTLIKILKFPVCVFLLHLLLTFVGGYYWWTYTDNVMHVLGGVSIALASLTAIQHYSAKNELVIKNRSIKIVLVVALVALAAVGWEFFEFILDHSLHVVMQPSIADTMGDLLCGLIGGTAIAITKTFSSTTKE